METRKEVIKQMGDEMKEDIFLEVNRRIHRNPVSYTHLTLPTT